MGRRAKAAPSKGNARRNNNNEGSRRRKKRGEYTGEDFDDLVRQLKPLGLHVRRMEADGNCLFRAFADQLIGDCEEHQQFRDECCDLLLEKSEEFELFHCDEEDEQSQSFEAYVNDMRHPARWGSQLELMALCQRYNVNAIVHQLGRQAYEMGNAPRDARCIQLSYHDGEHYNSIRFAWDVAPDQPAQHISLLQMKGPAGGEEDAQDAEKSEDVQQVREFLPLDSQHCATAIRAALVRAGGDASTVASYHLVFMCVGLHLARILSWAMRWLRMAAEYLLKDEVAGSDADGGDGHAAQGKSDEAAASEDASIGKPNEKPAVSEAASTRATKAEKKASRRKAKAAAEQRQQAAVASADDTDEKLSMLGKTLLSV